jgi:hypothetical protein
MRLTANAQWRALPFAVGKQEETIMAFLLTSEQDCKLTMRLLVLSDLHHELWRECAPRIDPSVSLPDVVILAGDINTGAKAVEWAARTFAGLPVLYCAGNHEAYGKNLEEVQTDIESACQATANVHFMNCEELVLGRARFLGTTLWTDFRLFAV